MNSSNSDNKKIVGVDRSSARLSAVQALYEIDMTGVSADPVLLEFLKDRWKFHSELTKDDQENCPNIIIFLQKLFVVYRQNKMK